MGIIKAIETKYNGYKFRSRLEARWAVFFDNYGIAYEYELEGYELGNGKRYLPDFFLPALDLFVEVKPNQSFSLDELMKIDVFAMAGDKNVLLIMGTPTNEEMVLINRCSVNRLEEYISENEYGFSENEIVAEYLSNALDFSLVEFNQNPISRDLALVYKRRSPNDEVEFKNSLLKAKQAQFEHGKSG